MASPIGFEPMTRSLEGCCSIQLSYGEKKFSVFPECQIGFDYADLKCPVNSGNPDGQISPYDHWNW